MVHEVGSWKMAFVNGPTSWYDFRGITLKKISFESFGLLTKCKPNVDQEEWACTKNECAGFF